VHGKPAAPRREQSSETRQKLEGKVTQVEAVSTLFYVTLGSGANELQGVGKFMKRLDKLW